jgi:hypothetical protein
MGSSVLNTHEAEVSAMLHSEMTRMDRGTPNTLPSSCCC